MHCSLELESLLLKRRKNTLKLIPKRAVRSPNEFLSESKVLESWRNKDKKIILPTQTNNDIIQVNYLIPGHILFEKKVYVLNNVYVYTYINYFNWFKFPVYGQYIFSEKSLQLPISSTIKANE